MAFALAINNLLEALKKPGCPACRIFRQASERALESFLWENVNEPDVRQGIIDSYGFCPTHSRVMVAREILTSSIPLGTNIIYEHLGRLVATELKKLRPGSLTRGADRLLRKVGLGKTKQGPLHPRGTCPACLAGNNAAINSLHVLCDEIQKSGDVKTAYLESDGLCLAHLRDCIENHADLFADGVRLLIDDTVARLEGQSRDMKEYIRKSNWSYRGEQVSEDEDTAWRQTLGFFSGLPGESFTHKTDLD